MPGIGSSDDHEVRIPAGRRHRRNLLAEFLRGDQLLAVEMTTSFRKDLVLDVERRGPRPFVLDHGSNRAFDLAESGVGVGDDRDARCIDDFSNGPDHLGQGQQTDVRSSSHIRGRTAGDVAGVEACFSNRHPHQRIERSGNHDDVLFDEGPKAGAGMLHE